MKKIVLLLTASLLALSAAAQATDTLRILAIGNSFSEDAVENNLWELLDAAGIPAVIGNMYIGGCPLEKHWNNVLEDKGAYRYRKIRGGKTTEKNGVSIAQSLADEKWQYVSFQQSSPNSGLYETYKPYLENLVKYVQETLGRDVTLMFHQTWAYSKDSDHRDFPTYGRSQQRMYDAIMEASRSAMNQHPEITILIPNGTTIQNARTSALGDNLCRDGFHLNYDYGRFAAACTWYAAITGNKAQNNPWKPANIDDNTAAICRKSADMAIAQPYKVTAFGSREADAELVLPSLMGSHMVLQRGGSANIWGVCNSGRKVTVRTSWNGKKYQVKPDENGRWCVSVETGRAGGPYTIEISAKEKIVLDDIYLGEVWICSGQSNMNMPLYGYDHQTVRGGIQAAMNAPQTPQIRLFTVPQARANAPQENCGGEWKTPTVNNAAWFSATAYFFGKALADALPGVPIGLISTNWGGTSIECWTPRETLRSIEGIDQKNAFRTSWDDVRPGQLFNAMIYPLHRFTARGFIWYQGEANTNMPKDYPLVTAAKVKEWRRIWRNENMPYYLVQIAPYSYDYPDGTQAAAFMEQQWRIPSLVPHSGVASTTDIGCRDIIHPPFKQEVGTRLAYLALTNDYGFHGLPTTPTYKSMEVQGGKVRLSFDGVSVTGNCFCMFKDGKSLEIKGFEVKDEQGIWHEARAEILWTTNQIDVWNSAVTNPVAVRYAYHNWTEGANVVTDWGMPLPPFCTETAISQ